MDRYTSTDAEEIKLDAQSSKTKLQKIQRWQRVEKQKTWNSRHKYSNLSNLKKNRVPTHDRENRAFPLSRFWVVCLSLVGFASSLLTWGDLRMAEDRRPLLTPPPLWLPLSFSVGSWFVPQFVRSFFVVGAPLPFGGSHLRLPSGPAGIRTTTGSLSASSIRSFVVFDLAVLLPGLSGTFFYSISRPESWTRLHCSELHWCEPVALSAGQPGAPVSSKA